MEKKESRFRGMKKHPFSHLLKVNRVSPIRKKKATNSSITSPKGLSNFQLRTQEEFMKVRPGETQDQWLLRTRFRRIRSEEELANTTVGKKKIALVKKKRQKFDDQNVQVAVFEKEHDFLKYYIFVINWACIKYNLAQEDIEVGLHFHLNIPFTKEQFFNRCLLFTPNPGPVFSRLINNGKMGPVLTTQLAKTRIKRKTDLYSLAPSFVKVLSSIYKKMAFTNSFEFEPTTKRTMHPDLEKELIEMARECKEILLRRKDPHKFLIN